MTADIKVEQFDISQPLPRSFGYHIGDKFKRSIVLQLRHPYTLDNHSLPTKGRLTQWLALDEPQIEQQHMADSIHYHIQLHYQIVNIDSAIHSIDIPRFFLSYGIANDTSKLVVPASRVSATAIINDTDIHLQADRIPSTLAHNFHIIILSAVVMLCSSCVVAYFYWGVPFFSRKHPFAEAYRILTTRRQLDWDDDSYNKALQNIHQAFNQTAGKTVFADKLDEFFSQNRQFDRIRSTIEYYFEHSTMYFFAAAPDSNKSASKHKNQNIRYSRSDLLKLLKECRTIERGIL